MPGRRLPPEERFAVGRYARPDLARRRAVLRETLEALERDGERYARLAQENLQRWRRAATTDSGAAVRVVQGDWGEVAGALTRAFGRSFAVLNMANAHVPGGAYVEGTSAQEENMFRRTDCHLRVADAQMIDDHYTPEMTALLSGAEGRVYLDLAEPRVCIRGAEDRAREDLGYRWLADEEVFQFYELRAAAEDLRGGLPFREAEARRRIEAQLDTLVAAGVRHAVLSAFGCGAFENPPMEVARIYREALEAREGKFDCVAFAIFHPGYGPDNYSTFRAVFGG